jgi:hypothetical protein
MNLAPKKRRKKKQSWVGMTQLVYYRESGQKRRIKEAAKRNNQPVCDFFLDAAIERANKQEREL